MIKSKKLLISTTHLLLLTWQLILLSQPTGTVNLNLYDKLSKQDLLDLDSEVTKFYYDDYQSMSARNVTFDEELFRSLRSLRHTVVIHLFDALYSNEEIMRQSIGGQVNEHLCLVQLRALVSMAQNQSAETPLEAVNFLDSSAKVEPGVLNGNFYWRGSPSSCERAKIGPNQREPLADVGHLEGRYCVAHLRARKWPKQDKYFGNRLAIKSGICIPKTCHSKQYFESPEMQSLITQLALRNYVYPFNQSERYHINYLYCFPDEDSHFRMLDFGTKAFIGFALVWLIVLVYTNIKYQQRMKVVKKLRESSIDIKMIINRKRNSSDLDANDTDEDDFDYQLSLHQNQNLNQQQAPTILKHSSDSSPDLSNLADMSELANQNSSPNLDGNQMRSGDNFQAANLSLQLPEAGSKSASPLPSDIEENDGEFNAIRPIVVPKRSVKTKRQSLQHQDQRPMQLGQASKARDQQESSEIDLIKAFSIKSNLDFLFKTRSREIERKGRSDTASNMRRSLSQQQQQLFHKRLSQQLNSINRRISSSNEALIKDLHQDVSTHNNVAIVESTEHSTHHHHQQQQQRATKKRVDVDIFDGIKVFATSYIVFGHTLLFSFGMVLDLRFSNERMFDFTMIAILNAIQIVGLFYIITGTLSTYLAFSKQKAKQLLQPTFWLLVVFGRYIRLIPTYLLVYWFARHVAPFTGAGSAWLDYRTDLEHPRGQCGQQDWSTMLFLSAADVKIPYDCVPQAWYLSNDFRTLLVIPFFIVLLVLNTYAGYAAIFAAILYSTMRMNSLMRIVNIDYGVFLLWQPHVYSILFDRLHAVYTKLEVRLSTYLLGLIVGHLLYLYECKKIKAWPNWLKSYGLPVASFVAISSFMGAIIISNPYVNQFLPRAKDLDSDTLVLLVPFFKFNMEFSICIILLLLATGNGFKWLRQLLSCKTAKVLSQISYGVFLIHIELMYKMPMNNYESRYWFLFVHAIFFIISSNIIAFFIYVLYEMPINNMTRQLFRKIFKLIVK